MWKLFPGANCIPMSSLLDELSPDHKRGLDAFGDKVESRIAESLNGLHGIFDEIEGFNLR